MSEKIENNTEDDTSKIAAVFAHTMMGCLVAVTLGVAVSVTALALTLVYRLAMMVPPQASLLSMFLFAGFMFVLNGTRKD